MSWLADDSSGFPYPEATALAVRTALWWNRCHPDWPAVSLIPELRYLEQSVDRVGIVWQKGRGYLFDSALVLAALADARDAGLPGSHLPVLARLEQGVASMLRQRQATLVPVAVPTWSTSFGPHQVKALALAVRSGAVSGDSDVCRARLDDLLALQGDDGGFRHPGGSGVLLHAHCYALEGLAMLSAPGTNGLCPPRLTDSARAAFERGLDFLVAWQSADGTFPTRANGVNPLKPVGGTAWAGDVTVQAGRLLALAGRSSVLPLLDQGLSICMGPDGLVRYSDTLRHRNSWASLFALQYLWARSSGPLTAGDLA